MPARVSPCHAVLTHKVKMQVNRVICVFDSGSSTDRKLVRAKSLGQFFFSSTHSASGYAS